MCWTRHAWVKGVVTACIAVIMLAAGLQAWPCTVAVVSARASATGRPMIWKNYDWGQYWHQEIRYFPAKKKRPGGYLLLCHNDPWMTAINNSPITPQTGVNEGGFAIAMSTVVENANPNHESGNLNTDLIRDALENCVTLADFESYARSWFLSHYYHAISGNFVVIDAQGGAALYEMFTGYATSGWMPIMYRKYDANTGAVTDNLRRQISPPRADFPGFVVRANYNYWFPGNPGVERYTRATELLTSMATAGELTPRNVMARLARDVTGRQDLAGSSEVSYDTSCCISRSTTRSGTVVDGVAKGGDSRLTTFWCALGEPSISVFVPFFASAKEVPAPARADSITAAGAERDDSDTCLLNLAEDERETLDNLIYSSNRADAVSGAYDLSINKRELAKVQLWTLAIEGMLCDRTEELLAFLRAGGSGMASAVLVQYLRDLSDYCADYAYGNYITGSSSAVPWAYGAPHG
jgi:hypothetical protein